MKNNPIPEVLENIPVLPVILVPQLLDVLRKIMYYKTGTNNITNLGVIALLETLEENNLVKLQSAAMKEHPGSITIINRIVSDGE